ncbi:MAG TPA: diguanylate cyclase [Nitrospiria bacterium]
MSKMHKNPDPAQRLADRANWQPIQDRLATMTSLSLLTYNQSGELLFPPSQENEICKLSQQNPIGNQRCQEHCGRQVTLAAQTGEGAFFKCHANLQVFSVPLVIENTKIILLGGKTYYSYQDLSEFRNTSEEIGIQSEQLLSISKSLPFKEEEALKAASSLLKTMGQTLLNHTHASLTSSGTSTLLLTLLKILAEARGTTHPKEFAPLLLNTLGVLFNIDTALFFLHHPVSKSFKVTSGFGRMRSSLDESNLNDTDGLLARCMEEGKPFTSQSLFEILKSGFPDTTYRIDFFPILLEKKIEGIIVVMNTPLTPEEFDIISTFSSQVSLLFENIGLQRQFSKTGNDLFFLNEMNKAIGSELDAERLCNIILEKSSEVIGTEQGSLMLLDETKKELRIKAIKGLNPKIVEPIRIEPGQGISGYVAATGEPLLVENLELDQRVIQDRRTRYKTNSFISIPLKLNHRIIGVLNLTDKVSGEIFSDEDLHLLTSIANQASIAIERSTFFQRTEELKQISITDSLTNLLNRRYFHERMAEEIERSRRHGVPLSLMMIDLDDFKRFNDSYGHLTGDEALKAAAKCFRNCIRTIDVAARYGGEEFTVILPQTTKEEAAIIAERICGEMKKIQLPFDRRLEGGRITVSLGLATFPEDAQTQEELINNADLALYRAKTLGKDQVVLFQKNWK